MNSRTGGVSITTLRWVLGVVVFIESLQVTISSTAAHHFAKMGMPEWAGRGLGGVEAVAAILFLIPATCIFGGYVLLATFAIAASIHVAHGEADIGGLLVYGAAVFACNTHRDFDVEEARNDR